MQTGLEIRRTPKAVVRPGANSGAWRLEIPAGPQGIYKLAQLDNYTTLPRAKFPYQPPLRLSLRARVSDLHINGTWGFGLWNDPFTLSLGLGGGMRRFPALPNAAWFFFASPQNYLSFQDDKPAKGFLAQSFQSKRIPTPVLALSTLGFPLLLWHRFARRLRPIFRRVIEEDSFALGVDVTQWHSYTLEWQKKQVIFKINNQTFITRISPKVPMGLVIWIDNQYAAFQPDGRFSYGTLENIQPSWLEIEAFSIK
jgi:hypothetical protein